MKRAHHISHERAHRRWRPILPTSDTDETGEPLNQQVLAGPVAVRALLAVARDGTVNEVRLVASEGVIAEPELLSHAWTEIFHEHVGRLYEPVDDLAAGFLLQVKSKTLFVAIARQEEQALPAERVATRGPHRVPTLQGLDLDHLRAHVGQHLGTERPNQKAGQIDDANPLQRQRTRG